MSDSSEQDRGLCWEPAQAGVLCTELWGGRGSEEMGQSPWVKAPDLRAGLRRLAPLAPWLWAKSSGHLTWCVCHSEVPHAGWNLGSPLVQRLKVRPQDRASMALVGTPGLFYRVGRRVMAHSAIRRAL